MKQQIKNLLRPFSVTLLAAAAILLAGALLFTGVWALLPDRTNETHSYAASFAETAADVPPVLYPWNRMTIPLEDSSMDKEDLCALLDPFLAPQLAPPTLHVFPYLEDWENGDFFCDETKTLFGFRNADIWVRTYSNVIMDTEEQDKVSVSAESILQYRFSFAFREQEGSIEICFVSLEPPPRKEILPSEEEAGLSVLTKAAKTRDLDLESGNPFAVFLWRYTDLCAALDCDYTAYNSAMQLFETGNLTTEYIEHVLYCTFTGREGAMTLLCDPVYQTVFGISLERY